MIRELRAADMPEVTRVRTSVVENHLSVEQMAARGITPEGIIADMEAGHYGAWVAEENGGIVAFSMADARNGSIFALFTAPGHEGRGHGSGLLNAALTWLKIQGLDRAWLSTGRGTRAELFYAKRGWSLSEEEPGEDVVFRKLL